MFRAGASIDASRETGGESAGQSISPGAWLVPPSRVATRVLEAVAEQTGLPVLGLDRAPEVGGFRMKRPTRVGLYKVANNMPAGWLMWLLEQYEFDHQVMSSTDFDSDLSEKYDVILLPAGTSKRRMLAGLAPSRHDESWRWAFGIGDDGWERLRNFVEGGGTLVAVGNAVATARNLLDLPIEAVLPAAPPRFRRGPAPPDPRPSVSARDADAHFKEAFESPAQLVKALESRVVDPTSVFYCPGSLLEQDYNVAHPVAFGMPARWPVFFRHDQAYRLKPSFEVRTEVVSKYPDEDDLVASGWLLGGELLRDHASVVAFEVGRGHVVTLGSQVEFRTQTPATFKLLFNALVQGPADELTARELERLR